MRVGRDCPLRLTDKKQFALLGVIIGALPPGDFANGGLNLIKNT